MIKFSNLITSTYKDIPNEHSMMIYNQRCSLNCLGCFHKNDEHFSFGKFQSKNYILEHIKEYGDLFDNIILSGGTFLEEDILDIINFVSSVRNIFKGKIILYDTGFNFNKLQTILPLIDGVYLDIKVPINSYSTAATIWKGILGTEFNEELLISLIESIKLLNHFYKEKIIKFRTVKYNVFTKRILSDLFAFVNLFFPNIEYVQNDFIETDNIVLSED